MLLQLRKLVTGHVYTLLVVSAIPSPKCQSPQALHHYYLYDTF